jgi:hypothetical protein
MMSLLLRQDRGIKSRVKSAWTGTHGSVSVAESRPTLQLCLYDSVWPFRINLEKIHFSPSRWLFIVVLFGYRAECMLT